MEKLVYFTTKHLLSETPSVRFEEESLWIVWGFSNGICIPAQHIIDNRNEFEKLSDFIGQILQDHEVKKGVK